MENDINTLLDLEETQTENQIIIQENNEPINMTEESVNVVVNNTLILMVSILGAFAVTSIISGLIKLGQWLLKQPIPKFLLAARIPFKKSKELLKE
jgi:hypothetical protein